MRPGRLRVDGLGAEYVKIENNAAIANTQDLDQFNISSSPRMASLTRTRVWRGQLPGSWKDQQADWSHKPRRRV